ncbi:NUDIX domain-containing protein [Patescibacteria group bacterium]
MKITCTDIKGNKHQVDKSKLSFRPSVYALIIQNNKILLQKHWDGYNFPGGGVELSESMEESLKREVLEETGLKVEIEKIIACEDSFFIIPFEKKPVHSILIYYLCKVKGGKITTDNFDKFEKKYAKKAEWVDLEKAKSVEFCGSVEGQKVIGKI